MNTKAYNKILLNPKKNPLLLRQGIFVFNGIM